MSEDPGAGPPSRHRSGDPIPADRGRRYYRWTDPDTHEVGGYECLEPPGTFATKRGKEVTWTDVGACPSEA
ncbi:hypothetical protein [Saccharothrix australiensis]|uniref:Uncharacterized protein n=1 Tax=Saccharothrix australiensis TaxID=2072 RepID=A0A495W6U4_9PSEU|nr:hypothetical protein [Saccharothrix australiensis]RKT57392.1 hypothetical protein C8E97_6112 [Saccharothrix australiensis]